MGEAKRREKEVIFMCIGNYYGTVEAYSQLGKYYMVIDDYNGNDQVEISEEFFNAIRKEFVLNKKEENK